jgi:hypothetical protein
MYVTPMTRAEVAVKAQRGSRTTKWTWSGPYLGNGGVTA